MGWGTSLGNTKLCKIKPFCGKIFTVYVRFLCINEPNLVEELTVVLQKVSMLLVLFNLSAKIVTIYAFSSGKIWFEGFAPCKRFDISQLCLEVEFVPNCLDGVSRQAWLGFCDHHHKQRY